MASEITQVQDIPSSSDGRKGTIIAVATDEYGNQKSGAYEYDDNWDVSSKEKAHEKAIQSALDKK